MGNATKEERGLKTEKQILHPVTRFLSDCLDNLYARLTFSTTNFMKSEYEIISQKANFAAVWFSSSCILCQSLVVRSVVENCWPGRVILPSQHKSATSSLLLALICSPLFLLVGNINNKKPNFGYMTVMWKDLLVFPFNLFPEQNDIP